jgi:SOS-response transcriptional repressor LexA
VLTFADLLLRWSGGRVRGAQTRFGAKVGVAPNTVSQWVRGISQPSEELQDKVAGELRISVEELQELCYQFRAIQPALREPGPVYSTKGAWAEVPVYGRVGSGAFQLDFLHSLAEEYLPLNFKGVEGQRYGALKVRGSGLEPAARDGDYLILARSASAPEGRLAVVRVKGNCYVRRVHCRRGMVALRPEGRGQKTMEVRMEDLNVVALAVGAYRKVL